MTVPDFKRIAGLQDVAQRLYFATAARDLFTGVPGEAPPPGIAMVTAIVMKFASEADAAGQFDTVLAGFVANPESDTVHEAVAITPVGARSVAFSSTTRLPGGEARQAFIQVLKGVYIETVTCVGAGDDPMPGAVTAITHMVQRYEGGEVRIRHDQLVGGIWSMLPRERDLPLHVQKATDAAGLMWSG